MIFRMKKRSFFNGLLILFASLQIVACQNEDDKTLLTPDGKVDVSKAVQFKVNFADYNADEQIKSSRAGNATNDTISRQFVELENGLVADIVIKKDRKPSPKPVATRALENGSYTMLAYKNGILLDSLKGTISGGTFMVSDSRDGMGLGVGTYDLFLYNDKVTRIGNKLTVKRENVETALIGQTQYTVTASPQKQLVIFEMKHAAVRVNVFYNNYSYDYDPNSPYRVEKSDLFSSTSIGIPNVISYNAATNKWSIDENKAYRYTNIPTDGSHYFYVLPATDLSTIGIIAKEGKLYRTNLAQHPVQTLLTKKSTILSANGSYQVAIQLLPKYYYLMSDGTIGMLNATTYGGGTKTPIAIVLSRSKRLAMGLEDANLATNSFHNAWKDFYYQPTVIIQNSKLYPIANLFSALNDFDGEHNTWDASASKDGVTIKADRKDKFPAFYSAAHYNLQLTARGVHLTNGMENKRWFLPGVGEWALAWKVLGFSEDESFTKNANGTLEGKWYRVLWQLPLTEVKADDFHYYRSFWTSTQCDNGKALLVTPGDNTFSIFPAYNNGNGHQVKAFVHY